MDLKVKSKMISINVVKKKKLIKANILIPPVLKQAISALYVLKFFESVFEIVSIIEYLPPF